MSPDAVSLLEALPDPLAEAEYRRQLSREAFERGRALGDHEGYERASADLAADWHVVADPASRGGESYNEYELRRWGKPAAHTSAIPGLPTSRRPRCSLVLALRGNPWACLSRAWCTSPARFATGTRRASRSAIPTRPGWYPAEEGEKILAAVRAAVAERDARSRERAAA